MDDKYCCKISHPLTSQNWDGFLVWDYDEAKALHYKFHVMSHYS